jgi:hypothetical protein
MISPNIGENLALLCSTMAAMAILCQRPCQTSPHAFSATADPSSPGRIKGGV